MFLHTRRLVPLLLLALPLPGQEKATTASGRVVLLFPDGTWKEDKPAAVPGGREGATRPRSATEKFPVLKGKASIYYDPQKWKPKGPEEGGRSGFNHVDGDAQSMVITERIQMPLASLEKVALDNAKAAAPDATVAFREMRRVNGQDLLALQIKGTINGIAFIYYGYYYSGERGIIQAIAFTSQNLFQEYKADFEAFLNGLVIEP
ncbi:MAG: hypothetical protein U0P81_15680 [Holophagaceae bacterium]